MYDRYLKLLFWTEQTFYDLVAADHSRIELDKIFLIKTIGDEFWYAYKKVDLNDQAGLRRTAAGLMDAVLGTFRKTRPLRLSSRPVEDFPTEEETDGVNFVQFDPPLKGAIDLLTDVVELNNARFDYLKGRLLSLAQARTADITVRNKIAVEFYNNPQHCKRVAVARATKRHNLR